MQSEEIVFHKAERKFIDQPESQHCAGTCPRVRGAK
jgi:hypothetical protein